MRLLRKLASNPQSLIGGTIVILVVGLALLAPVTSPYQPEQQIRGARLQPPSYHHWLGTDEFGRDVLSRIMHGARVSLRVGLISAGLALVFGTALGLVGGYFGGAADLAVSFLIDALMSFPSLILALAIVAVLGPSLENTMIAIGVRGIPTFARLVRGATYTLRNVPYVEAAEALAGSHARIIVRHILPNVTPVVVVQLTLYLPSAILMAASLGFIGLGAQPPTAEWGAMLASARSYLRRAPWIVNYTGLAIVVTVLGFNMLGNALRDHLDPRLRGK
jgi:peptide/nickel transport system permease protein